MFDWDSMKNKIILADNKDIMKDIPDKFFELAIVDPPYGIDIAFWDSAIPDENYFKELFRISQNQIIWGGNYFNLPHTESWICWDKTYKFNRNIEMSEFELAWNSFNKKAKFMRYTYCGNFYGWERPKVDYKKPVNIHPTQKPIDIYRWLLQNYAKTGDKIIDTHSGSGSCAIACHLEKFDFLAIEKDEDYHKASVERLEILRSQGVLF